jgi:hypothetical protein
MVSPSDYPRIFVLSYSLDAWMLFDVAHDCYKEIQLAIDTNSV